MRLVTLAAVTGFAAIAGAAAQAEETIAPKKLGYYVGAEFGSAKTSTTAPTWVGGVSLDGSTTGWSVFAGVRPYTFLGAELSYSDYGNQHRDNWDAGSGDTIYRAQAKTSSYGGYAVGYLPLVPNHLDLFAKLGFAGVNTKSDSLGNYVNVYLIGSSTPVGVAPLSSTHQGSGFAYGFGTQYRFSQLGVRAEYQRITTMGSPALVSLGAYWNF
jgi:hypothetical protein